VYSMYLKFVTLASRDRPSYLVSGNLKGSKAMDLVIKQAQTLSLLQAISQLIM